MVELLCYIKLYPFLLGVNVFDHILSVLIGLFGRQENLCMCFFAVGLLL